MTLQELKLAIENNHIPNNLIIFKNSESSFIASQYTHAIAQKKNLEIKYIEDLAGILQESGSIFNDTSLETDSILSVYKVDILKHIPLALSEINNLIIITNKVDDEETKTYFKNSIVEVPKLEEWQWKDYVYSLCEGVQSDNLDWLLSVCKDRDRLTNEVDKIIIFNQIERAYLFEDLMREGLLDDLSSYNIFTIINMICKKDIQGLSSLLNEFKNIDINEFGFLTLLLKNFRNLLSVQLSLNPTTESLGIDSKQLYALKKMPRVYSQEQLINIYLFLCDIDRKIKSGELPTELVIDYILCKVLTL